MADHGGQPQGTFLAFDVTDLQVTYEPGQMPTNVLKTGDTFKMTATFGGKGIDWTNMRNAKPYYEAKFYAEGIGLAAPEIDFATESGNLDVTLPNYDAVTDTFTVSHTEIGGIASEGIYRIGVLVTFPGKAVPFEQAKLGVLGFYEGLLIQVSPTG